MNEPKSENAEEPGAHKGMEEDADANNDVKNGTESGPMLVEQQRDTSAQLTQKGFFPGYFDQAKEVLIAPRQFFTTMPVTGGLLRPTIFLLVSASVYSLLQAISKLNFFVLFTAMFSSVVSVFIASAIIAFASKKLGGKGTFEGTFRVIAYSKATLLFAWLSLGAIPIGGIVSTAYSVYLNILGIEKIQQMPRKIVATLIIVVAVIGLILKFRFGG